jgi:hypothetical protein
MKLDQIVEKTFRLMGQILDESISLKNGVNIRDAFVYRHARNIYQLGNDIVFLLESNRLDSCPIIVRSMLESLFKLVASVKEPNAAVQILISEVEDDISRITKWLDPVACAPAIRDLTEFTQRLRREYHITSTKKWTALACAEAAELGEQYRGEYFHFSGHTHATTGGILLQENLFGAGQVLQVMLSTLLTAAAHAVQAIPTKSPQNCIDESTKLLKQVIRLMETGGFRQLNGGSFE